MIKKEIQKHLTKNNKPLPLKDFHWDGKTSTLKLLTTGVCVNQLTATTFTKCRDSTFTKCCDSTFTKCWRSTFSSCWDSTFTDCWYSTFTSCRRSTFTECWDSTFTKCWYSTFTKCWRATFTECWDSTFTKCWYSTFTSCRRSTFTKCWNSTFTSCRYSTFTNCGDSTFTDCWDSTFTDCRRSTWLINDVKYNYPPLYLSGSKCGIYAIRPGILKVGCEKHPVSKWKKKGFLNSLFREHEVEADLQSEYRGLIKLALVWMKEKDWEKNKNTE